MKKFVCTFYQTHPFRNFYQPVYADNIEQARKKMFEKYGLEWGFIYEKEKWDKWIELAKDLGIPVERSLSPIYARSR